MITIQIIVIIIQIFNEIILLQCVNRCEINSVSIVSLLVLVVSVTDAVFSYFCFSI